MILARSWVVFALAAAVAGLTLLSGEGSIAPAAAQPAAPPGWPTISLIPFAQGLIGPSAISNAGDDSGRLFIGEISGAIRIVKHGVLLPEPFLDLSGQVCTGEKNGVFSVAFPPDFAQHGLFYIQYTRRENGNSKCPVVLSRFGLTANPDVADLASEEVLLSIKKETSFHNGGQLAFSPRDGYLYMGVGDDDYNLGPANRADGLDLLVGKILRVEVFSQVGTGYGVPASNPFTQTVAVPTPRGEIWAYGLRNPYRIAFDPLMHDLYIADVGDIDTPACKAWEEVNFQPAASTGGEHYGWNFMQGHEDCHDAQNWMTRPVFAYNHDQGDCAIIGGAVYRGNNNAGMQGMYIYGDFCSGRIGGLRHTGGGWESAWLTTLPDYLSDIGVGEDGELYAADFYGGVVYRLVETPYSMYLPAVRRD